jgi:aminoglycoside phosphotransferase
MYLANLLSEHSYERITLGMSGAEVYRLPALSAYLKIGVVGGFSELGNERHALEWLAGKFPVPSVLGFDEIGGIQYLLTSALNGVPASDLLSAETSTIETQLSIAANAAQQLRKLHELPIDHRAPDQRLAVKFARASKNVKNKLLSETDDAFAAGHEGKSPGEVLRELLTSRPDEREVVFTHGDPCMPNIIVEDGEIVGFIDLDGAGVADRYVDIAIFFRSFHRNCRIHVELVNTFCEAYGIDGLDQEKFDYYARLDDLF